MEAIKIMEKNNTLNWEYDDGADVLYISVGEPRPALGTDIGEGLIVRYDEKEREIVGLTVIGLRARTLQRLALEP